MPKKKYDDEALRGKALELRKLGMSYREIAERLGCSTYKAHQLITRGKNIPLTPARFDKLAEDIKRLKSEVANQLVKIRDIETKIKELEANQIKLSNEILDLGANLFEELDKLKGEIKRI